jgi:hypothetical protein
MEHMIYIPNRIASNQSFIAIRVLLLGLFSSQLLASIQVYLSNMDLYNTLQAIRALGYLPLPNQNIMNQLLDIGPAFYGGFFFSLSIGAGLTIFTFATVWIWDNIFSRNKIVTIVILIVWSGCLIGMNLQEVSLMTTSYLLIIPAIVIAAMLKWRPPEKDKRVWLKSTLPLFPILFLGPLWLSLSENNLFLNFRDHLLLTNSLGQKISDFYYEYTLYPAEVIKNIGQKTLKTVNLKEIKNPSAAASLRTELLNYNYIDVGDRVPADLKILESDGSLILENRGRSVIRTSINDLLSSAGEVLEEFSSKSYRLSFFRQFTLVSIMFGFPLMVYCFLFFLFRFSASVFLTPMLSIVIASALCFLIGMAILTPLYFYKGKIVDEMDLGEALLSDCLFTRIVALKSIEWKGVEIGDLQAYPKMLSSPHIPERYWLVRVLGISRQDRTYKDLLAFLDDPSPNVVSMAFYSLGKRGDQRIVPEIIRRIEISNQWYCQMYAYNALMALGWKQTESR